MRHKILLSISDGICYKDFGERVTTESKYQVYVICLGRQDKFSSNLQSCYQERRHNCSAAHHFIVSNNKANEVKPIIGFFHF
jgi:hypothetical protein